VWLWAVTFLQLKATQSLEDALILSTASFSTLGEEKTATSQPWRLLIALESVDGFILIGWSIAFLVAASTRHGPFREGEHF
jgi:hypothetical protein